jgi:hypothetical protein
VGASYADWVAFPTSVSGLGVGHGPVALFLTFLIVIFVGYLAVTRKDVEQIAEAPPPSARYQRGLLEESPYPARRREEQPRRTPEGFSGWDDR